MKQRILRKQRFLAAVAIFFLFCQANGSAATIVLRRPVSLQAETVTHLRQAHALDGSQWQLVVFGFTHCKDVCPVSLSNLSMLMKAATREQIKLDGTFVTVDPERDTNEILAKYTTNFGPDISYLRFEGEELERFKAAFSVETIFYTKNAGNKNNYQVDHSTSAFLIDPEGKIRVIFDALKDADSMARIFRENKELFKS
ncbi:protein SCO1/2 [Nitrosospira sp. Nsp14]|uniref:SCO family protein n=1 Tax=Nitrosospira sp. Nsp14 TaxID=1855333 RepID=UPI0008E99162|nr:SCO family protein [Nitrosospira sp. Nsp14]SFH28297.1 protein SCO1/2 [Nitrosospira sp. Nsp14]